VVWCLQIVTCCDCQSHCCSPGCKESWTWSKGHFSVKWMSLPLENADRKYSLERILSGNWNTDTDCMSSGNERPCWDAGDTFGWGTTPGRAEILTPWAPSLWKASPHHDTLKEKVGCHLPAAPPGFPSPNKSLPVGPPEPHLQASQATTCEPTRLMPHMPTGVPPCWRALAPPHTNSKPA
jgi:hypothetical protein